MRKPPSDAQRAWAASPRFREIGSRQCRKMNAERWAGPRCGAKRKHDGEPCTHLPMANGRCRFHGGRVPKGKDWHVRQKPAATSTEAVERKIRERVRVAKRRAARLAAMTPEGRAEHEAWQRAHKPGDPKRRAADRARRQRDREAGEFVRQERPETRRSAERAALVAAIEALERQHAEADAAPTPSIFD